MTLTPSTMLPLDTPAPPWRLPEVVTGKTISLETFKDKQALLVMFICRHCPYVQHVKDELSRIGLDYRDTNLGIVAISANDTDQFPDDAPDSLKSFVQEQQYAFPLCFDATQEVAKAYTASCTPDFFLFNTKRELVYRGQLDDSRPGNNISVTGRDLRAAIKAVLADQPIPKNQKPSIGCNIKWKPGNEPDYFIR